MTRPVAAADFPLSRVVDVSEAVAATASRNFKSTALAGLLGEVAARDPSLLGIVVGLLTGSPRQRRTGVGYRGVGALPPAAVASTLTVIDVDDTFTALQEVTGSGSAERRRNLLQSLLVRATSSEQSFLVRVLLGELRQGALESALVTATAVASGIPLAAIRRAVMLQGDAAEVAVLAMRDGSDAVARVGLQVGRPIQPMLASSAKSVAEALAVTGNAGVEEKLDGVRAQIHVQDGRVSVFTRTLDDVTDRVPEVVALVAELAVTAAVFDAELIALGENGRPRPFQETAARFATHTVDEPRLSTVVFDVLHLDGADLLDRPARERWERLDALLPAQSRVRRVVTAVAAEAEAALDSSLADGHEGVVVKAADSPYQAGRRAAAWVKVKPVHTLDLVVLAAEWGSGRRTGRLSNLHLGARADDGSGWVMLGKTFKGLTDAMLTWQTERLLALADGPTDGWVVRVRPVLVVEIAYDGVQRSSRYPGGVALRFARVLRYREDKTAAEAATLSDVRAVGAG